MRDGIDEYTLLCEDCGYVIEGLPREGQCPECGKAVAESLPEQRDAVPSMRQLARRPVGAWTFLRIEDTEVAVRRAAARCMASGVFIAFGFVVGWIPWWIVRQDIFTAVLYTGVSTVAAILAASIFGVLLMVLTFIESCGLRFIGRRRGFRVSRDTAETVCSHACFGWVAGSIGWLLGWVMVSAGVVYELLVPLGLVVAACGLLGGLLVFETLAYLGLRRCKFANRVRPSLSSDGDRMRAEEHEKNAEARR